MTNQQYAAEKTTGASAWANNYLGHDPHLTLEAFQKDLTVNLIQTPRSAFETCGLHEALSVVVERNRANKFDFLPVVELLPNWSDSRNRIVGLIELVPFMQGADVGGLVHQNMRPLSDENLIGADASILTFVRDADRQRCRLIVSGRVLPGALGSSLLLPPGGHGRRGSGFGKER